MFLINSFRFIVAGPPVDDDWEFNRRYAVFDGEPMTNSRSCSF